MAACAQTLSLRIVCLSAVTAALCAPQVPASELASASRLTSRSAAELNEVTLLDVVMLTQREEMANCGPTAAAMLLTHAARVADPVRMRDRIGLWSWDRFPLRSLRLPGRSSGMTSPAMMWEVLEVFGGATRFTTLEHPFLPGEAYALPALRHALASGRPVLMMVESPVLWGTSSAGLHWIVVRGVEGDAFVYNDPADGTRQTVSAERLWRAWRLHPLWRQLPGIGSFTAFVAEAPGAEPSRPLQLAGLCAPHQD